MENTIELLKKIPLFRTLSLENLFEISSKVEEIRFNENKIIFNVGDEGDSLYIIKSGTVQVIEIDENDNEIILAELGQGSYFGEMALLTGDSRSATIKTFTACTTLKLSKEDFQELINKHASMYIPIAYVLSQRLKEGNEKRVLEELERQEKYTPSGQLSDNAIIDVIRYCEDNALTGSVFLKNKKNSGKLDFDHGKIVNIILNDDENQDHLVAILKWKEGSFRIEPKPFIFKLEKAGNKPENDEKHQISEFTLKDLVSVLNLITNFTIKIIGKTIVENFLVRSQKQLYEEFPDLYLFKVESGGYIELYENTDDRETKDDELIATAIWVRNLVKECSRYDFKFETFDVKHCTHSYYEILQHIGFYDYYLTSEDYEY